MKKSFKIAAVLTIMSIAAFGMKANADEGVARLTLNSSLRCEVKCYPYNADSCLRIASVEAGKECQNLGLTNCKIVAFRESVNTKTRKCKWGGVAGSGYFTQVEVEGNQN